jgi:hypothetical protein
MRLAYITRNLLFLGRKEQLAEVRSLVNGDPKLINAVDAVGIYFSYI